MKLIENLKDDQNLKTISDGGYRFYFDANQETRVHRISMTTAINRLYPKGKELFEWGVKNGHWYKIMRDTAGVKGTVTHDAIHRCWQSLYARLKDPDDKFYSVNDDWLRVELASNNSTNWEIENTRGQMISSIKKYMESYFAWIEEYDPFCIASEFALYHPDHLLAGRTDQLYRMNIEGKNHLVIVDNKTGNKYDQHLVQTQGYAYIYNTYYAKPKGKVTKVATLYLKDKWIKKPTFGFKLYDYDPTEYLAFVKYFKILYGEPKPKQRYKVRKEFEIPLTKIKGSK